EECTGGGCGASQAHIAEFVAALDTTDVMIMSSVVNFGSRVTNAGHRQAIANFWTNKGYVAIHAITDSHGNWDPLDTIHGTQFRGHPAEQNGMVRVDSVFQEED